MDRINGNLISNIIIIVFPDRKNFFAGKITEDKQYKDKEYRMRTRSNTSKLQSHEKESNENYSHYHK